MRLPGLFFFILFTFQNLQAQKSSSSIRLKPGIFTEAELLEDIRVLRTILYDLHPSLYLYNTRSEIEQSFDKLSKNIQHGQSERKFYRNALEVISKINCGHTWLNASRQLSDSLWKNIEDFPLEVRIVEDRLIYSGNNIEKSINKGNEIKAINGIPSRQLIQSFMDFTIGDGFIKTGRIRMVERRFGFYFALLYGFPSEYTIKYVNDLQRISQVDLPAGAVSNTISSHKKKDDKNIILTPIDSTTGKLKISSFSNWTTESESFSFKKALKEAFQEIHKRNLENLIIDLRDNRGGSDANGLAMLSYLVSDSIMPFKKMYSKRIGSPLLQAYGNLNEEIYRGFPEITTQENDTTYVYCRQMWMRLLESNLPEYESTATISCDEAFPPNKPTFNGNLYVLTNGNTFSTAADVSSILFSEGLATFFGEETGGGYYGNTSGITATVTLPNTRFQLRLPLIRYETNVKKLFPEGRGVIPEYPFEETIQSLGTYNDEMLCYAIQTIKYLR